MQKPILYYYCGFGHPDMALPVPERSVFYSGCSLIQGVFADLILPLPCFSFAIDI